MQIEAGKYYRTRVGNVVGPMQRVDWCDATFFAVDDLTWNEDGSYVQGITYKLDLISEVYVSDTPLDGPNGPFRVVEETKTLRDEFAMVALSDCMSQFRENTVSQYAACSLAYNWADAMMEARKK